MRESEYERERGRERERNEKGFAGYGKVIRDATTFFFSRFPEDHSELDLWRIFQRFGRVVEVFIAKRRNRWGRRFGFVRFLVVSDKKKMETDLDKIYIGNLKMYVNLPRYKRVDGKQVNMGKNQRKIGPAMVEEEAKDRRNLTGVWSFAQVVAGGRGFQQWKIRNDKKIQDSQEDDWKGIDISTIVTHEEWLMDSWIG